MKILHYIYIFFISSIDLSDPYFIQNKKICANCKFFIANKNECGKFGDVNIITGERHYESAINVRNDENKCGEYAIFFEKNNFKFITIPYYFVLDNWMIFFSFPAGMVYFLFFYTTFK